ncbi:MAG: Hsp20/alpha crystallin family protein [Chloroflexi bacterium]|nr:Hsp20/alpha crystallin family protein [Chloroflexota bacterium]
MANRHITPWQRRRSADLDVRRETDPILSLQNEMNRMFDTFFEYPFGSHPMGDWESFAPSIDVYETDKEIKVDVELPGIDEKDIDITLGNNVLTISGKKETEETEKNKSFYRHERSYGSFRRSIQLPDDVDEDKIDATYNKGILKIVLPKTEQSVSLRKKIEIKKG